jgi:hypothetical protein
LSLSKNNITEISGLEELIGLQRLNLSNNKITKIENLSRNSGLKWIDLSGNQITNIDSIFELSSCSELNSLYLKGESGENANPICNNPQYVDIILRALPNLQILDGGHVGIIETYDTLQNHIENIKPDDEYKVDIPPTSWFDSNNVKLAPGGDGDEDDTGIMEIIQSGLGGEKLHVFTPVANSYETTMDMLKEDCALILRKSSSVMTKTKSK